MQLKLTNQISVLYHIFWAFGGWDEFSRTIILLDGTEVLSSQWTSTARPWWLEAGSRVHNVVLLFELQFFQWKLGSIRLSAESVSGRSARAHRPRRGHSPVDSPKDEATAVRYRSGTSGTRKKMAQLFYFNVTPCVTQSSRDKTSFASLRSHVEWYHRWVQQHFKNSKPRNRRLSAKSSAPSLLEKYSLNDKYIGNQAYSEKLRNSG